MQQLQHEKERYASEAAAAEAAHTAAVAENHAKEVCSHLGLGPRGTKHLTGFSINVTFRKDAKFHRSIVVNR